MIVVMLEFENGADVERFVERGLKNATIRESLRGIYQKPTKFCEGGHGKLALGWTRNKKGWWVCNYCMLPHQTAWRDYYGNNGLGRNLLAALTRKVSNADARGT